MLILFLQIIYWCTYRRLGLVATSLFFRVIHETLQIEQCQVDLGSPDQHWKWTQGQGPALCHTAFFKVKCINLVFSNYLLVYLQVPVLVVTASLPTGNLKRLIPGQEVFKTMKFQPV